MREHTGVDSWTALGPDAVLWRFAARPDRAAFEAASRRLRWLDGLHRADLLEAVPGFTTLLLIRRPGLGGVGDPAGWGAAWSALWAAHAAQERPGDGGVGGEASPVHEVPVVYDGPDIGRVATHAGLRARDVAGLHAGTTYHVHCLGFAPGFPYLGGLDPRLHTPRLEQPRPRVPTGSVAIGGEHSGIYPVASPGGWNLIGRTGFPLFRPAAETPGAMFPVRPGDRVKFLRVRSLPETAGPEAAERDGTDGWDSELLASGEGRGASVGVLQIERMGAGLTMQDGGRPGWGRFGVPPGGWMDPVAGKWANQLLDNPPDRVVLELAGEGQRLQVIRDGWVSVSGAAGLTVGAGGRCHRWAACRVRAGDRLHVVPGSGGLWTYLGVPGGFAAPRLLGSASTAVRSGIGWMPRPGGVLRAPAAERRDWPAGVSVRRVPWTDAMDYPSAVRLRVWTAPQTGWFEEASLDRLGTGAWTVSSLVDRVGYRLEGPPIEPPAGSLVSEPVLPGSIQVPASGHLLITMVEGPTLGGYAKIGRLDPDDLRHLAQLRPGAQVQFEWVTDPSRV